MGISLNESYKGLRVLVTGHTGFKGSWLSQWLLHLGANVAGYSDQIPTTPSLFEALSLNTQVADHRGDIRDLEKLAKVFKEFNPEIVFHLAAQPLVRASYDIPRETFAVNVMGTVNVLEVIRTSTSCKAGVIVTTDKTYENTEQNTPFIETDRLGGRDPYSASKAAAEIVFHSYVKSFFSTHDSSAALSSVRAGNVIGGGDWAQDRLIPDCVKSWSHGTTAEIRNAGAIRPWQHVLDPLLGYLRVGEELLKNNSDVRGESFNFGPSDGAGASVKDLVEELRKGFPNAQIKLSQGESETKYEAKMLRLNSEKAKRLLQWSSSLGFKEMTRLTSEWYSHYYTGAKREISVLTLGQIKSFESLQL